MEIWDFLREEGDDGDELVGVFTGGLDQFDRLRGKSNHVQLIRPYEQEAIFLLHLRIRIHHRQEGAEKRNRSIDQSSLRFEFFKCQCSLTRIEMQTVPSA